MIPMATVYRTNSLFLKRDQGLDVNNYRDPNAKEFYDRAQ